MSQTFKFTNITISGGIGVGTTTLMRNLQPYLEPYGWQFKSTGQFIREYTKENLLPTATLVSDDFDRDIEKKAYETLKNEKNRVVEAWLGGFVARDLPHVLRVLLTCSKEDIRVDRIANRDNISISLAKENIKKREEENFKKWKRIYGDYNFFGQKFYSVSIDTYESGPLETVGKVLDVLGYKNSHLPINNK